MHPSNRSRKRSADRANSAGSPPETPHIAFLRAPVRSKRIAPIGDRIRAATYNVHRWTGINGRSKPDPRRAEAVIGELGADVIALQEVIRPSGAGDDPLVAIADRLGFHVTFAATRTHRRGELGNAILSRWPIEGVWVIDLTSSRLEKRLAVAAQVRCGEKVLEVVATHLSLADLSRRRQVRAILDHPRIQEGPALLLGDMNAWRRCRATRALNDELRSHNNRSWPPSFPAVKPVFALDRVYGRGVEFTGIAAHNTSAARRASDHLPVIAGVKISR